ncbi:hypothetical protein Pan241w_26540 [Gimesia alba]|uniref:Uncharacterized protein n=1 Tax=Gimesia alba TaxID=2527973 RepID=A0A517RFB5_9PLAN|nr:hypothetical protein Pan241w_26540 [Gimesia alba]
MIVKWIVVNGGCRSREYGNGSVEKCVGRCRVSGRAGCYAAIMRWYVSTRITFWGYFFSMWLKQGTFMVLVFAAVPVLYLNQYCSRARRITRDHADRREAVKSGFCTGRLWKFSREEVERSRICGL